MTSFRRKVKRNQLRARKSTSMARSRHVHKWAKADGLETCSKCKTVRRAK